MAIWLSGPHRGTRTPISALGETAASQLLESAAILEGDCRTAADDERVVECPIAVEDDWLSPAGLGASETIRFALDEDFLVLDFGGDLESDAPYEFNRSFHTWLRDAHPDVYREIEPGELENFPGVPRDPSDMTTAIEYLDEFLAESDEYPIEP